MTDLDLDTLTAALAAATQGQVHLHAITTNDGPRTLLLSEPRDDERYGAVVDQLAEITRHADAELIEWLWNAAPQLLAELTRLRAANEAMRNVVDTTETMLERWQNGDGHPFKMALDIENVAADVAAYRGQP